MNVCILAAGMGTRMGNWGETLHKALLPLGNLGIISHIVAQFSLEDHYIMAVGYRKEQVMDYIRMVHPQLKITFVEVENFNGPGSGPGLSLYSCREHLKNPFIFTACDTLITSPIPECQENWVGVKRVEDIEKWCSFQVDENMSVKKVIYKKPADTRWAFVGIGYVQDVEGFWSGFERNQQLLAGELQVNNGLEMLVKSGLRACPMEWEDTGNEASFKKLLRKYEPNYSFEGKSVDFTYRRDDTVIKFYHDPQVSSRRFKRAADYKNIFAPVKDHLGSFYSYIFQPGTLLSQINNEEETASFLAWAETNLWKEVSVDPALFEKNNRTFYQTKSLERLKSFCQKYMTPGEPRDIAINDINCLTAEEFINGLGDDFFKQGTPSSYHGDLHDDNIIVTPQGFRLIDWRDAFGDLFEAGDRYYDLAKYLHTLEFSVEAMAKKEFTLEENNKSIIITQRPSPRRELAEKAFWKFVEHHRYDHKRIKIIDALIFINMAAFYEKDLAKYLYYLGRHKLQIILNPNKLNLLS